MYRRPHVLSSTQELTNPMQMWEAKMVFGMFLTTSGLSLILNFIILFGVLRTASLRTLDSLMTLQLVIIDLVFSMWGLGWFVGKMALIPKFSSSLCQAEGAIFITCVLAWLLSSHFLSYYAYLKHTGSRPSKRVHNFFVLTQYSLWIIPFVLSIILGFFDQFQLMPSLAYCSLPTHPGSKAASLGLICILLVSFIILGYFYYAITTSRLAVVRDVIEAPDPVYLPRGYPLKDSPIRKHHEATFSEVSAIFNHPPRRPHKTALLAIAYPLTISLCLLPSALATIYEVAAAEVFRPAWVDAVTLSIALMYKVISPLVTLTTNTTIKNQVKGLLNINRH